MNELVVSKDSVFQIHCHVSLDHTDLFVQLILSFHGSFDYGSCLFFQGDGGTSPGHYGKICVFRFLISSTTNNHYFFSQSQSKTETKDFETIDNSSGIVLKVPEDYSTIEEAFEVASKSSQSTGWTFNTPVI